MQYVSVLFVVLPSSGGTPPLLSSASTTVYVNLLDLNDNDPAFLNLPFVAEVPEGLSIGSSVFRVSIWLVDVSTGTRSHWLNIQQAKTAISFSMQETWVQFLILKCIFEINQAKLQLNLTARDLQAFWLYAKEWIWHFVNNSLYGGKVILSTPHRIIRNIIFIIKLCFCLVTLRFKSLGQYFFIKLLLLFTKDWIKLCNVTQMYVSK